MIMLFINATVVVFINATVVVVIVLGGQHTVFMT